MIKYSDPQFEWDENNKIARCTIIINTEMPQPIVGQAICAPEDMDMCNEKTGCDIAYQRAIIKLLKWYKCYEIKPRLDSLNKLYYSMNKSKYFNSKSYENKMLQRQIRQLENELNVANDLINERKEILNEYIENKDKFYQMVRSLRRVEKEEELHKANN